jgi:deoxyhypusine synthase
MHINDIPLNPPMIPDRVDIVQLVDEFFLAYNAARLREACHLLKTKILKPQVTVGLTLSGALTPTGLGYAAVVPLIKNGFVDWIVSTGANLYHDMHRSLGFNLYQHGPQADDVDLHSKKLIRIYDIIFPQEVLYQTDAFIYRCLEADEFQHRMSSAELHHRLGRYTSEREKLLATPYTSILSAAYEAGVPIYTSSPGDSTIGMNIAAMRSVGKEVGFDPEADVTETTAIVYRAKQNNGERAIIVFGGGSPKNFALQTEPQLQEILGFDEKGHDYFIQITDARPDTGGLSGATPQEALTWGKVNPEQLASAIVCYADSTIALPIIVAYARATCPPRPLKRLYDAREESVRTLNQLYHEKWQERKPT